MEDAEDVPSELPRLVETPPLSVGDGEVIKEELEGFTASPVVDWDKLELTSVALKGVV